MADQVINNVVKEVASAAGPGDRLRRTGILVALRALGNGLGKQPGFMVFAFACIGILGFAAYKNHEPIATAVGIVAVAVFGGGAWKNHADKAYANGNGNGEAH